MTGGGVRPTPTPYTKVDMGLPSGLLWAAKNIGAFNDSNAGLYFSWGNVEGHSAAEEYPFTSAEYATTPGYSLEDNIDAAHDAATALLGGQWRMPSHTEFGELRNNCEIAWTTKDGVRGMLFTSNINGAKLFFPAAGYGSGPSINEEGVTGNYWTSDMWNESEGYYARMTSYNVVPASHYNKWAGFSIRAVCDP